MKFWPDDKSFDEFAFNDRDEGCLSNDLGGKWLFPVFEIVQIGWVDYKINGGQRNLWIDDFGISTKLLK